MRPAMKRLSLRLGGLGQCIGDHAVFRLERHEPLDGLTGSARIEGQPDGPQASLQDHELAAVLPDEGRQAWQRDLRPQPVLVDAAVAVEVPCQRLGGRQELVPGPVSLRQGHTGGGEEVPVDVHDQRRDVLRKAHQLAAPAEGVDGLRVEVALGDDLAGPQVGFHRLQDASSREGRVATVVDERHVRRASGGEVGPQAQPVVALAGDMDELDVDVRVGDLEGRDQGLVGGQLGRIAEDHEGHVSGTRPRRGPSRPGAAEGPRPRAGWRAAGFCEW